MPPDPDESVSELVEHFFLVNHPDSYLTHQVGFAKFALCVCVYIIERRGGEVQGKGEKRREGLEEKQCSHCCFLFFFFFLNF